jgi:cation:H+ antiporter
VSATFAVLAILAGLALLAFGGEALVRGAVSLARLLNVQPAVIGLTIVAMGTSTPELAVSLLAAAGGKGDLAVANVVGSNIFNIAVIVGLTALFVPITVHLSAVRLEWPVMATVSAVGVLLALDGRISRLEGGGLLLTLVLFTAYMIRVARRDVRPPDAEQIATSVAARTVRPPRHQLAVDLGLVVFGIVLLVGGADLLVHGAVTIAKLAGLSERVIGLTIVAAGTGMPELATSIVAARRGQADIALANVLGSNIFNIAGVLGAVSLLTPQVVHPQTLRIDLWWMVGYAVALFPIMRTGMRVSRWEGAALLLTYGVYVGGLAVGRLGG